MSKQVTERVPILVKLEVYEVNNLVGKLLTIIDASYTDATQRTAVKQLIKNVVWDWAEQDRTAMDINVLKEIEKHAVPTPTMPDPRLI